MKFNFKLEKVLQHRKTLEDVAQRDFLQAEFELRNERNKLTILENEIVSARDNAYRLQSVGGRASPGLVQVDTFIKGQEIRIDRQKERIKECESLVENLREILRQKAIDYKIILELREKKLAQFKEERRYREQKRNDDLNIMRYRRRE